MRKLIVSALLSATLFAQGVVVRRRVVSSVGGSGSAPTYVHSGRTSTGGANCVLTANVTAGQTLVVYGMTTTMGANVISVSDSNGNTYTPAMTSTDGSDGLTRNRVWTAPVGTTNASLSITVHVTSTTNTAHCDYVQVSGTGVAVDKIVLGNLTAATSPIVTGSSGTTSQANELLIAFYGIRVTGGFDVTPSTGFAFGDESPTVSSTVALSMYRTVSATGNYAASSTVDTAANVSGGVGIIVALKAN